MRTTIPLVILLLWCSAHAAEAPRPAVKEGLLAPGYELAWFDEFDGRSLDTERWLYRTGSRHWSTQKPENVSVADGRLRIALKKEAAGGNQYTAGGVISRKMFRYGYYEASLKVPPGAGWHTSFWMMRHDGGNTTGTRAAKQELDVIENDSINPRSYGVNTHKWVEPHRTFGSRHIKTPDLSAGFHVFGCEFTPQAVRYFFDGELVQTVDATQFEHGDQQIWLTSIASHLGNTKAVDDTKLPGVAEFEYVRFYEKR